MGLYEYSLKPIKYCQNHTHLLNGVRKSEAGPFLDNACFVKGVMKVFEQDLVKIKDPYPISQFKKTLIWNQVIKRIFSFWDLSLRK